MNRISLILLLILFSCKNHENDEPIGLIKLDSNWEKTKTYYWNLTETDSTYFEINQNNINKYESYNINESFELNNNSEIKIQKNIWRNSKTRNKISETDTYTKSLNSDFITEIKYGYNYKSKEYFSFIIDLKRTKAKKNKDSIALKKFYHEAERKNTMICGTAMYDKFGQFILKELPREIEYDSILIILKNWKLNY